LQKTKLFLDLFERAHDTDKYNIQCVDKTVKCACISKLAASFDERAKPNITARNK